MVLNSSCKTGPEISWFLSKCIVNAEMVLYQRPEVCQHWKDEYIAPVGFYVDVVERIKANWLNCIASQV